MLYIVTCTSEGRNGTKVYSKIENAMNYALELCLKHYSKITNDKNMIMRLGKKGQSGNALFNFACDIHVDKVAWLKYAIVEDLTFE